MSLKRPQPCLRFYSVLFQVMLSCAGDGLIKLKSFDLDVNISIMKKGIIILALVAAGVGAAAFYFKKQPEGEQFSDRTAKVVRGEIISAVSASGVVEPNFQVEVKSKASGEILEFPFEPGDSVTTGQKMVTLDPKTEKRSLAQTEADLARVNAELKSARATLMEKEAKVKRALTLFERGLISSEERESAVAAAQMAHARVSEVEAAIRKAELAVEDARERLEETVIVSPIDGVIVEKSVERGQIISSGITSFTGGTKLCVIADLSRVFVIALVDETDIGRVFEGQEARVTVDAYPDNVFNGKVERIYPVGETQDNITVFKVKIEALAESRELLKPKMTANVDMILEKRDDTLIVPDEVIKREEDGEYVFVIDGGKPVRRKVVTGITNGFETEIRQGLKEGDEVLLRPPVRS